MNCTAVTPRLPLYAGDELPDDERARIGQHLAACPDCAAELQRLQTTQAALAAIIAADTPAPLPSDFPLQVHRRIVAEGAHSPGALGSRRLWRLPVLIPASAAALVLIVLFALTFDRWSGEPSNRAALAGRHSLIDVSALSEQFGTMIEGPFPIGDWNPSGQPGVFMLLHKPAADLPMNIYSLDYCGESDRLESYRGSPWIRQRQGRLIARAGSPGNIYIIIIVLPRSSDTERQQLEDAIRREYKPFFNYRNGA